MLKRYLAGSLGGGVFFGLLLTAFVGTPIPIEQDDAAGALLHRIAQDTFLDSVAASNAEEQRYRRSVG